MDQVSTLENFLSVHGIQNFKSNKDFELIEDMCLESYEWEQYYYLDCWARKYTHDPDFKYQITDMEQIPPFITQEYYTDFWSDKYKNDSKYKYKNTQIDIQGVNKILENITPIQQLYLRIENWIETYSGGPEISYNEYPFDTNTIEKLIDSHTKFQKIFQHLNLEFPTKDTLDKLKNQVLEQDKIAQGSGLIEDLGYEYMSKTKFRPFGSFIAQLQDVSYSENFERMDYMVETSRKVCFNGFTVNLSFNGDDEGSGNKYIRIDLPSGKSSYIFHTEATPEYIQDIKSIMEYFKLDISLIQDFNDLFLEMIGAQEVAKRYLSKKSLELRFKIKLS